MSWLLILLLTSAAAGMATAARPPESEPEEDLDVPRLKYWAWWIGCRLVFAPVYVLLISEGFRTMPSFARRVFGHIDIAMLVSPFFMLATFYYLEQFCLAYLGDEITFRRSRWAPERLQNAALHVGGFFIVIDLLVTYLAFDRVSWGGGGINFFAVVLTFAWFGVLVWVALVSADLKRALL